VARANQISAKPTQRATGMVSCTISTPHRNCSVGAMYWSRPIIVSGIRTAAAPKNSKGSAGDHAAAHQKPGVRGAVAQERAGPPLLQPNQVARAGRKRTSVSMVRLSTAPICAVFFNQAIAGEAACQRQAIQGGGHD